MNDTELITWIAEHLLYFRPGFGCATMTHLDDDGITHETEYKSADIHISCTALLRGCIAEATKK